MKGQNMTQLKSSQSEHASVGRATIGRLFVLEASGNRVLSLNPDGSDRKVIVTECRLPDGIAVDVEAGHIYWTNMGVPNRNDGSIERADLDGRNRKTIIPQGGTFTPKQLQLDKENAKLYWCDREGMRVMRANLDGSNIETLVDTSHGDPRPGPDATRWCVGIAVDPERGHIYWTQKGPEKGGLGRLLRANIEIPKRENRSIAPISMCCTRACQSPSTWNSISRTGSCTGPTAETRRAATRSTGPRWTRIPGRGRPRRFCTST